MSHKNFRLPDILKFTLFSLKTFISIFDWYLRRCCIGQASFIINWFTDLFLTKNFCKKVLFFYHRGRLQALKVRYLKLSCLSQLCGLKDQIIKVGI